jgi:para-nitrobenzyl esterase
MDSIGAVARILIDNSQREHHMRRSLAASVAVPVLSVIAWTAVPTLAVAADPAPVRIDSGQLAGALNDGVVSFRGVPYAAAPVGDLRWRAPAPVQPWSGVRSATKVGPLCMQKINPRDNGVGPPPASEDCLNLDVYTPADRGAGRLPVMFWIHGGGYVNGSGTAALYDGTNLAKQGVVVVSINYRLGRFGFFAHPALAKENPRGPLGNYGLMDQIAALQWVKRNIAAFGGDPGNVTIFGESAGGGSVNHLLVTPAARGLFHKAISQSGVARLEMARLSEPHAGYPSAEAMGKDFATKLGVAGDDLAALRAIPADAIIAAGDPDLRTGGGPMIDGTIVPERIDEAFAAGHQAKVPYLVGSNALEFPPTPGMEERFATLLAFSAPLRLRLISAYGGEDAFRTNILSDVLFGEPARYLAQQHAAVAPVYLYRFSVLSAGAPPEVKAAPHASDRQYVFKTLNASPWPTAEMDQHAADVISAYWVAFARTGNPNTYGRPAWPRYTAANDELLDFTNDGPVIRKTPNAAILNTIGEKYAQARAE